MEQETDPKRGPANADALLPSAHPSAARQQPLAGPAADEPDSLQQDCQALRGRTGAELGSMRFILGLGLLSAMLAFTAAYVFL